MEMYVGKVETQGVTVLKLNFFIEGNQGIKYKCMETQR